MKKERIKAKLSEVVLNEGQLPWLPANPRQWTRTDLDNLKNSIEKDPDFLEDRPALLVAYEDKLLVFGGNMRTTAAKELGHKTIEAVLYTPEDEEDQNTIKRRAILDNGAFGSWDYDALANEWDDLPLADWGVPAWKSDKVNPDEFGEGFQIPDGERVPFQQISFQLADEQAEELKEAIKEAKELEEYKSMITYGNENSNANALSLIIEQWIESRK